MVLAVRRTLIQWSEAMHLHPEVHPSNGTVGAGYQIIPSIQLPREHDLHVLAAASVADSAALALVGVSAQFVGP
jgi:hypothetical protein